MDPLLRGLLIVALILWGIVNTIIIADRLFG